MDITETRREDTDRTHMAELLYKNVINFYML